jgi:hypothetical protein
MADHLRQNSWRVADTAPLIAERTGTSAFIQNAAKSTVDPSAASAAWTSFSAGRIPVATSAQNHLALSASSRTGSAADRTLVPSNRSASRRESQYTSVRPP